MVDGESSEHVQLDVLLLAAVDECVSGKLDNIQTDLRFVGTGGIGGPVNFFLSV